MPIVTFNPLRERGLDRIHQPAEPGRDADAARRRRISSQYHQVKAGGDIAAMIGIVQGADRGWTTWPDDRRSAGARRDFINAAHARLRGVRRRRCAAATGPRSERRSGLTRSALEAAATVYAHAEAVIGIYGMGLTQHRKGVETVQMLVNLLLLRGNIGRPGAGICPVRGHSNVQGQRTVGITEKPELVPLDKLKKQFGFEPPREKGLNTVEACEKILDGEVHGFIGARRQFRPRRSRPRAGWSRPGASCG